MRKKVLGFTLIEVMIVLVIVGILAMIAIPAYNNSVNKSRRADGKAALMSLQLAMEKYRGSCTSYATTIDDSIATDDCANSKILHAEDSSDGHYALAISSPTSNSYTITATPKSGDPQENDTGCTSLTIAVTTSNPKGARGPTGCW